MLGYECSSQHHTWFIYWKNLFAKAHWVSYTSLLTFSVPGGLEYPLPEYHFVGADEVLAFKFSSVTLTPSAEKLLCGYRSIFGWNLQLLRNAAAALGSTDFCQNCLSIRAWFNSLLQEVTGICKGFVLTDEAFCSQAVTSCLQDVGAGLRLFQWCL